MKEGQQVKNLPKVKSSQNNQKNSLKCYILTPFELQAILEDPTREL